MPIGGDQRLVSILTVLNCADYRNLKPEQNVCHFANNIFNCIFLNANVCILIEISLNQICKNEYQYQYSKHTDLNLYIDTHI